MLTPHWMTGGFINGQRRCSVAYADTPWDSLGKVESLDSSVLPLFLLLLLDWLLHGLEYCLHMLWLPF